MKKILQAIRNNILFFIIMVITVTMYFAELPYSVYAPGGLLNIEDRLIGEKNEAKGSFNMTYVASRPGNIPSLLLGLILPSWDIIDNKTITLPEEDIRISNLRNVIYLKQAVSSATSLAYSYANKDITINNEFDFVTFIFKEAKSDLKIGDQLLELNGKKIKTSDEIAQYIQKKKVGDKVKLKVNREGKEVETESIIQEMEGVKFIGIEISRFYDYKLDPNIEYVIKSGEMGPSGGLMLTLSIYNVLIEEDITKGRTIAGTGTIEGNGTVGEIDGVKYKLAGAVKNKAEIFIVPTGNYKEAKKLVKKNNYKIKLIEAKDFKQVLEELEKE